jgi:hypothetical protein
MEVDRFRDDVVWWRCGHLLAVYRLQPHQARILILRPNPPNPPFQDPIMSMIYIAHLAGAETVKITRVAPQPGKSSQKVKVKHRTVYLNFAKSRSHHRLIPVSHENKKPQRSNVMSAPPRIEYLAPSSLPLAMLDECIAQRHFELFQSHSTKSSDIFHLQKVNPFVCV